MRTTLPLIVALAVVLALVPAAAAAPAPPANPFTARSGAAAMHGDSAASDTTPLPGPGAGRGVAGRYVGLGGPCPSILIGSGGLPVAVCTSILDQTPVAQLLDPSTGRALARLRLAKGKSVFAGVYPYLDEQDRLVVASGDGSLLRIAHERVTTGGAGDAGSKKATTTADARVTTTRWRLRVVERTDLRPALAAACPDSVDCGGIVGLALDWQGRVWFAATDGVAGFIDRAGSVRTIVLRGETGEREEVANSIATAPQGTAIATTHAQYLVDARADGAPRVRWRAAYDRGPARKPGQLSRGTGSTPTFFGPRTGSEYLAIVDNASPVSHLVVYEVGDEAAETPVADDDGGTTGNALPRVVCRVPFLGAGASGSENSPIGYDRSVVVASTYGYPYPAQPANAGRSIPSAAAFRGGIARFDVRADGSGCDPAWTAPVRSAAVPKLSIADGQLYTVRRTSPTGSPWPSLLDRFDLVTVDLATGRTRAAGRPGDTALHETMQLAGNVGPGRVFWQGTLFGVVRLAPRGA